MLCVKDASGFLTNVDGYFGFDQYFLFIFLLFYTPGFGPFLRVAS